MHQLILCPHVVLLSPESFRRSAEVLVCVSHDLDFTNHHHPPLRVYNGYTGIHPMTFSFAAKPGQGLHPVQGRFCSANALRERDGSLVNECFPLEFLAQSVDEVLTVGCADRFQPQTLSLCCQCMEETHPFLCRACICCHIKLHMNQSALGYDNLGHGL